MTNLAPTQAAMRLSDGDREIALRIKNDPRYFIETFLWIVNKQRQRVRFKFNRPQERFYDERTLNDLILKARKEGFSTLIEALFLHSCAFEQNQNAVTMAHTWDDTVIHLDRVKYFLNNLGGGLVPVKIELDKENQRELYFPITNSRYWIGTAGSRAFGRGRDITKLHLSEVAHYPNQGVITGVQEACVPGAWKVFETTANGVGEAFHGMWKEAGDPAAHSPRKRHFFAWFEDPTNRLAKDPAVPFRPSTQEAGMMKAYKVDVEQVLWYRAKRAEMTDKALMPQEHPSNANEAFLSSGRHCFDLEKVQVKKTLAEQTPPPAGNVGDVVDDGAKVSFEVMKEGALRVWKMPRQGRMYLIAADEAEGVTGGDWSVAQIFDRSSWEQVGVWRGRLDPGSFGRKLVELGYFFNNAVLAPELNNHGWATIEAIKAEKYPHLLKTTDIWKEKETEKEGFPTDERRRGMLITALRNSIDEDTAYFNDPVTLGEMETFIQNEKTGRFEAQKSCWDDTVISAGIGVYCLKHLTVDETYSTEARNRVERRTMLVTSVVSQPGQTRRRSRTGYR